MPKIEICWMPPIILIGFGVGLFIGLALGGTVAEDAAKDNAVKTGHAEYYLDKDHNKQWRWLPVGDKEETP